jgi:hypothetical protein
MARCGDPRWITLIILPPLFEEANRMRAILTAVMRQLAADHAIASILPDLPGTGDSTVPTTAARFDDWGAAVAAVAATVRAPRLTVAVRGGALLDRFAGADARWRLAPETGARLLRDMIRATALSSAEPAAALAARARCEPVRLAGHLIHPALFTALDAAVPDQADRVRIVRIDSAGDDAIAGTPVWRRAEPGIDAALISGMASDIAAWARQCAAR